MVGKTSRSSHKSGPSETVYLAAAPAVAYGLAFVYEAGHAAYFDIPIWLISVGVASIFLSLISLVIATGVLMQILFLIGYCIPRRIRLFSAPLVTLCLGALLAAMCFGFTVTTISFIAGTVTGLIFIYAWPGVTAILKAKPYREELDRFISEADARIPLLSLLDTLHPTIAIILVVYVMILLPLAYGIGRTTASLEQEFLVFGDHPEQVVLAIYGDFMVSAPLLAPSHQVVPTFTIKKIGEDDELALHMEKVGPLFSTNDAP